MSGDFVCARAGDSYRRMGKQDIAGLLIWVPRSFAIGKQPSWSTRGLLRFPAFLIYLAPLIASGCWTGSGLIATSGNAVVLWRDDRFASGLWVRLVVTFAVAAPILGGISGIAVVAVLLNSALLVFVFFGIVIAVVSPLVIVGLSMVPWLHRRGSFTRNSVDGERAPVLYLSLAAHTRTDQSRSSATKMADRLLAEADSQGVLLKCRALSARVRQQYESEYGFHVTRGPGWPIRLAALERPPCREVVVPPIQHT